MLITIHSTGHFTAPLRSAVKYPPCWRIPVPVNSNVIFKNMNKVNNFLSTQFPELKIQQPLFYNWPIGIRFETGPEDITIWQNENTNEEYFFEAEKRSKELFEAAFEEDDEICIIYQQFSDGRKKIHKGNFIFKQLSSIKNCTIETSEVHDIYEPERKCHHWKRACITGIKRKDINYINIIKALINIDFSNRKPRIRGECYFINRSKNLIFNIYDDRGLDIIATKSETIKYLYTKYNSWILNYDRKTIDATFTQI